MPDCRSELRLVLENLARGDSQRTPIATRFTTRSGETRRVELSLRPLMRGDSEISGYTGTLQDVTERYNAEKRIRYLAQYDPLTNLPNRILALTHLEQLIDKVKRLQPIIGSDVC